MTSLLPGSATELDALRRRAYGPDADIDTDPAALARLRELEQWTTPAVGTAAAPAAPRPMPVAPPPPADPPRSVDAGELARDATPSVDPAPPDHKPPTTPAPSDGTAPAARPWWRRPAVVIAALAVALLVIAATLTSTLGGGRPDRTLTSTPADAELSFPESYEWLTSSLGIARDSLRSFQGVGDVIVWAGTSRDGVDCLLVTSGGGPFGFGCSRDDRDATADIVLDSDMGPIESTGLAERSTIRFVYRGDRVDVWITEP